MEVNYIPRSLSNLPPGFFAEPNTISVCVLLNLLAEMQLIAPSGHPPLRGRFRFGFWESLGLLTAVCFVGSTSNMPPHY